MMRYACLALLFLLPLAGCGDTSEKASPPHSAAAESPTSALSADQLSAFAELALECIDRPYPYKPHHVITGPESLKLPREHHPAFYGCFDWHSAVHGHWMLVRALKTSSTLPLESRIRQALAAHFSEEALAAEAAYFAAPKRQSFERPYGWAWTLRLAAELRTWNDPQGQLWAEAIAPLEEIIVTRYEEYFEKLTWPIRTGVHPNSAFALAQAWDYATLTGNTRFQALIEKRARDFFYNDFACPLAYEPSGEDFFTPCFLEADLMRRVLPQDEFSAWIDGFLPTLLAGELGHLSTPAIPSDPSDPKISHLDGLNLVRAWTMNGVASALPADDPRALPIRAAAAAHTDTGLGNVLSGHYEGEHWLASFAIYLATDAGVTSD